MFKSSAGKIFFASLLFFASSCSFWRSGETAAPSATPFVPGEMKSEIPFSTKEPEIYQAEIISQTFYNGETLERKVFTARNGEKRLTVFDAGKKNEIARLETGAGAALSLYREKKIYAESANNPAVSGDAASDFLTTEWLNQKTTAAFENLGAENDLTKYRVKLGDAENQNSEILIYVDEQIKLPVRQEFYSASGEQKTLTFTVELKNFKTEADEKLFELPKDFRKVTPKEFQEILRQERTK
jgi:hypothetical protein